MKATVGWLFDIRRLNGKQYFVNFFNWANNFGQNTKKSKLSESWLGDCHDVGARLVSFCWLTCAANKWIIFLGRVRIETTTKHAYKLKRVILKLNSTREKIWGRLGEGWKVGGGDPTRFNNRSVEVKTAKIFKISLNTDEN